MKKWELFIFLILVTYIYSACYGTSANSAADCKDDMLSDTE